MNDQHPDLDDATLRTLRVLDPADGDLGVEQRARQDALLARILAEPRTAGDHRAGSTGAAPAGATVHPLSAARARRHRRARVARRVLIPAAAAAALAGAVVVGGSLRGADTAYASWTPTAVPATGHVLDQAQEACRAQVRQAAAGRPGEEIPAEARPAVRADTARTVLAEVRGEHVLTVMATEDGSQFECFSTVRSPGRVDAAMASVSTVASPAPAALPPDGIEFVGAGMMSGPDGALAVATGRVGDGVTGVTLHVGGEDVTASVAHGYFSAWWPTPVDAAGLVPSPRVDLTLIDGTVLADVPTEAGYPMPGPREIGPVSFGQGGGADGGGEAFTTASGRVGEEVRAVTVRTPGGPVEAEVYGGSFHAEWPGTWPRDGKDDATFTEPDVAFDVTLADGTVLDDVTPVPSSVG